MCVTCQALANTSNSVSGIAADCPALALDSGGSLFVPGNTVTVHFVQSGTANAIPSETITSEGWSDYEIERTMAALATISNYINLDFVQSFDPDADFQLVLDDNQFGDPGFLGFFYVPPVMNYSGDLMGAFNANGFGWSTAGLEAGGLGFSTIIHELLHGLGLAHPHDGDTILPGLNPANPGFPFGDYGQFGLNQEVYTIMSYNSGLDGRPSGQTFGSAATPMALDIAMLQELYGANTTFENGDSTYQLPDQNDAWVSIWDTGGTDEIIYNGTKDVVIDLREATLLQAPGGGGFISAADGVGGGFTIANGAIIENATGGSGDDTLIGNGVDNTLNGNNGNDTLIGGAGEDNLNGGNNNDTIFGGTQDDEIDAGSGNDVVDGNSGVDEIETSSGTNTLYGSSGGDIITGGSGSDTIFGGSGNDVVNGNGGNDILMGGRGDDFISGGAGDDQIIGGLGTDNLSGGLGADDFIFEFVADSQVGSQRDTITAFDIGEDKIDLSAIAGLNFNDDITLNASGGDIVVAIDVNGDKTADMEIFVFGAATLSESDFIL